MLQKMWRVENREMSRSRAGSRYPVVISRKKMVREGQEVEGRIFFLYPKQCSVAMGIGTGHHFCLGARERDYWKWFLLYLVNWILKASIGVLHSLLVMYGYVPNIILQTLLPCVAELAIRISLWMAFYKCFMFLGLVAFEHISVLLEVFH